MIINRLAVASKIGNKDKVIIVQVAYMFDKISGLFDQKERIGLRDVKIKSVNGQTSYEVYKIEYMSGNVVFYYNGCKYLLNIRKSTFDQISLCLK